MLSEQQIKDIASLLKIDAAAFGEAVKSTEEKAVTIPAGLVSLDESGLKRVKDDEYNSGKTAGLEMAIKDYKEKAGIDFQGKSLEGLAGAIQKKALEEAKIEPDKKVQALEADISTLRQTNAALTTQLTEKDTAVSTAQTEREIYRQVPTLGEGAPSVDKIIKLMKVDGYEFKTEDGATVVYKDGKPMKDNVANSIPLKDAVTGYAKAEKLIAETKDAPQGRGNGDSANTAIFTKLSELKKSYESQGKSTMGQEFLDHAIKLKTETPEFDMST